MIIYHGGHCEIKAPTIIKGRYTKDFEAGFYCTYIKEQEERCSQKYDMSMINAYNYKVQDRLEI